MTSLNALIKQIQAIAESHSQISNFAVGQRYDFGAAAALTYPVLWVVPNGASMSGNNFDYSLVFILMDLEQTGGENQVEILSDSLLILVDVLAKLRELFEPIANEEIINTGTFTPFVDAQLDTVSGHSIEVTIRTFNANDVCNNIFN